MFLNQAYEKSPRSILLFSLGERKEKVPLFLKQGIRLSISSWESAMIEEDDIVKSWEGLHLTKEENHVLQLPT